MRNQPQIVLCTVPDQDTAEEIANILIADKPAIVEVQYGKGKLILLGFRVQHRGQPHGTFALLFNAILSSTIDRP